MFVSTPMLHSVTVVPKQVKVRRHCCFASVIFELRPFYRANSFCLCHALASEGLGPLG